MEVLEGRLNKTGLVTRFEARFHLIEANRRLVYAYDLYHGDSFHSVTLSSLHLEPVEQRRRVTYTEQIVFLDGSDGNANRERGTELQYAMIEKVIVRSRASSW